MDLTHVRLRWINRRAGLILDIPGSPRSGRFVSTGRETLRDDHEIQDKKQWRVRSTITTIL
ncbi:hypothetical protein OIDMADRAFT_16179 [Oidiodendron maius Zn]|uniref:Uncharacterized protein n=1 Tax=Oidiodendron maius (strain Zn) TaxID=913774 RepID=A0A0C3DZJ6_OIDMZ|nr:hypothetical protein OIDMADRAFT_16179 [Oidiodendron maius Zn]